jgi:pimeloyl-ACP methyl ester carboxylesterase
MEANAAPESAPDTTPTDDRRTDGEEARRRLLDGLPVTDRRLRLNGISTAVLEGGKGTPLVLLHGPGEYAPRWFQVIPDLATTHRVVAPDLPGHGASEMFDQPPDEGRLVAWLDALIDHTCDERPVLVGHILGGAIAARYAAARGTRLSRLVLVDALGLSAFEPMPEFAEALMGFISDPTDATHDRFWQRCAFDLDRLRGRMGEPWQWVKAYNLDRARSPQVRAAQQVLMERFGMPAIPDDQLDGLSVPTTLIWGRHDLATRLPVAEAVSSRRGWPLHVIENAADDPPMEQPQAFLAALRTAMR